VVTDINIFSDTSICDEMLCMLEENRNCNDAGRGLGVVKKKNLVWYETTKTCVQSSQTLHQNQSNNNNSMSDHIYSGISELSELIDVQVCAILSYFENKS
jgi:hypothetical protein